MIHDLQRQHYRFGRLGLEVASDQREILEAIDAQFGSAACAGQARQSLQFEFVRVADFVEHRVSPPTGVGRSVFGSAELDALYFDGEDILFLRFENKVLAYANLSEGYVRVSILDSFANRFTELVRPFVMLPLIECFKRRGLHTMHAACLARNGRGVILAGAGRKEKHALSLAMTQAGFEPVSDDLVILNRIGPILRAVAFSEKGFARDGNDGGEEQVQSLHSETRHLQSGMWDDCALFSGCTPAVMLFPRAADAERGALRTMKQDDALLELLPNVLLTDSYSSQAHLDALGDVVGQCECFRLEMGHDLNSVAGMVGRLIY